MLTTPRVTAASRLVGREVVNDASERLGTIEEIMIDMDHGRIAYAVLSFGGFLRMGSKLFAIPWDALQLSISRERFILNVDKQMLENAPGFDKHHWPDMADRRWANEVHSYYGYTPYWD